MLRAAPALGVLAGAAGAAMHFAGALKSLPPLAAAPFDVTALAAAATLAACALLLCAGGHVLHRGLALPLLAAGGLWLWWVLAGAWSPWAEGAADRLPEVALAGPAMLALGLVLGAEDPARRALAAAALAIGAATGVGITVGLATDAVVLGGEVGRDPTRTRVAYQVAGLAIACAAALAALRAVRAASWPARAAWLGATAALGALVLLPGGRAAFAAAAAGVALVPALFLLLSRRPGAALGWLSLAWAGAAAGLALLLMDPDRAARLFTLERLLRADGGLDGARALLWGTALREAGIGGTGPGGFPVLAGMGQDRGFHPHNHGIEALVEGGWVGFLLWLGAFGGGVAAALPAMWRVEPRRAAEVAALVLPVAITVMVSTDLGNRMAWFALGLLLSLCVTVRRDV